MIRVSRSRSGSNEWFDGGRARSLGRAHVTSCWGWLGPDESFAYPVGLGPRTVFEVDTPLRGVTELRPDRRWRSRGRTRKLARRPDASSAAGRFFLSAARHICGFAGGAPVRSARPAFGAAALWAAPVVCGRCGWTRIRRGIAVQTEVEGVDGRLVVRERPATTTVRRPACWSFADVPVWRFVRSQNSTALLGSKSGLAMVAARTATSQVIRVLTTAVGVSVVDRGNRMDREEMFGQTR